MQKHLIFSALLLASLMAYSQAGILDNTFSGDGKATTPIGAGSDKGRAIAIQSDGKIVVAGRSFNGTNDDIALVRYNTDGTLDASFDGDGKLTTAIGTSDEEALSVALQSDGKIVVAGFSFNGINNDFALARYNTDGTLDASFDGDGKLTTAIGTSDDEAISVALQSDGKIVVAGFSWNGINSDFALARYNTDGTLDAAFDGDGKLTTAIGTSDEEANSVALQSDGKIVVAGFSWNGTNNDFALARYNTDGTLDASFDGDGKLTTAIGTSDAEANAVALQNDGKIVVAGFSFNGTNDDFALARYNTNGTLDATFDGDGKLVTDFATTPDKGYAMKLAGLRIYVAGISNNDFAVSVYLNDAIALRASLISFTATENAATIQLNWKTASEQNTAAFEIERSADAGNFTKLGTIRSTGNSSSVKNYSFTDYRPLTGSIIFYRLKMVDNDGSFTYSKIVAVNGSATKKPLHLFPNPANDVLYVQAAGINETAILQITDAAGRIMKQERIQLNGSTLLVVDVQLLPKGSYCLTLNGNKNKEVKLFVK